jgi:hypothetical protein
VIRYPDTNTLGASIGALVTQSGGYYIHTFTSSGTLRWG